MKIWMISFLVLFGMAELYPWVRHFTLPLPLFILGGALLAIASNYGKFTFVSFPPSAESEDKQVENSQVATFGETLNRRHQDQSSAKPLPKSTRPISFTIRTTAQEVEDNEGRASNS